MQHFNLLVIVAVCLSLVVGALPAADYYVDADDGTDANTGASPRAPWKTIAHALSSVNGSEGDPVTIHIAAGTYSPSANGESFPLQMKSYVSLLGDGADTVTLDAEQSAYHVIYCAQADGLTIEGLTLRGGRASGSGTDGKGGGVFFTDCSDVALQNCTVSENSAWAGAGIHCEVGTGVLIEGCVISDNSSIPAADGRSFGGGVAAFGASPTIIDCTIESNSAVYGAGMHCEDSAPRIANCLLLDNWCTTDADGWSGGGGVNMYGASPLIEDCTFSQNFTPGTGGAVKESNCYLQITRCKFNDNEATSGGGMHLWGGGGDIASCEFTDNLANWGGGISANDCLPTVKNCLFSLNAASYQGGGMYIDNEAQTFIDNCTFAFNSAGQLGGAIICINDSTTTIENSILWANGGEIDSDVGGSVSVNHCCVYGGYPGDGNIADNPLFVSGPEGDYYLSCVAAGQEEDSPCIDAGNDTAENCELDCLTTQTDGAPDSWTVDLGYHYPTDVQGELAIYCHLNGESFAPGDNLIAQLEVDNPGSEVAVDVYVAIVLPNGAIMTFTGSSFAVGLYPWFSDVTLVEGFKSGVVTAFETPVPGGVDGGYLFAAALTEPSTLTYLAGPSTYAFAIQTP